MKKVVFLTIILTITLLSFSCSYGLFNFSTEKGDLQLEFEIKGDNGLSVDNVTFELTPPDGSMGLTVSLPVNNNSTDYRKVDSMTAGLWTMKLTLTASGAEVQVYEDSFEIYPSGGSRIRAEAGYDGSTYTINFSSGRTDVTASSTDITAFVLDKVVVMPEIRHFYRADISSYAVTANLEGSGFLGGLYNLELIYPDGAVFSYGEYYPRGILFSNNVDDTIITITRALQLESENINGNYILNLRDSNLNVLRKAVSVSIVPLDLKIPKILGHDNNDTVPEYIMNSVPHTFQWELPDFSLAGTILLFVVGNLGNIYPTTDALLVQSGTSGELLIPSMAISDGDYELVIAAVENIFTTPIADAIVNGLILDMRPEGFAAGIRSLYGSDTGLITFSSVSFTYGP
ncbi:MAG: hypothetical protein JEZ04_07150 [Spirochaetales bacterium]|nr:hypothetical protein [Spirochaetales bacterium]